MSDDTKTIQVAKSVNVNSLGFFLDGWADLAEGYGNKADEVRDEVYRSLKNREMPEVEVERVDGTVGIGKGQRPYNVTTTFPGVTTAIYIGKHGKDLLVSWYTYIRPVLNWRVITVLVVIAAFIGLRAGGGAITAARGFSEGFFEGLISGTQAFLLGVFTFLGVGLGALVFELGILSVLGFFITRDPFWAFVIQPNVFDADDIVAMSLSAHKSILKALDKVGLDTALLRGKQTYRRRRNEDV